MRVLITQKVYSDVAGHIGQWLLAASRNLPALPRQGDMIELADGWCSHEVWHTTFAADGSLHVTLRPAKTDDLDRLAELDNLVTEERAGWYWYGGDGPFKPV